MGMTRTKDDPRGEGAKVAGHLPPDPQTPRSTAFGLSEQIVDLLGNQEQRYRMLKRILVRQAACLQHGDYSGTLSANAEIREAMGQLAGLEARLTPLILRWRDRPPGEDKGAIPEKALAMSELVSNLEDLRSRNQGLAKSLMENTRQEMVSLSTGAQAARGYAPRPQDEARFVDRTW